MNRTCRVLIAALLSASWGWSAELRTLSPQCSPLDVVKGKEADAIFGDYVLRNERIVAIVADPALMSGRSASRWSIPSVAGTLIDLTLRERPNDQLVAYYPGPLRFKPDAPNFAWEFVDETQAYKAPGREPVEGRRVVLRLPPYEWESGRSLSELAALPPYLRHAPRPSVAVEYVLEDGWPWLQVLVTYTNPTSKAIRPPLEATLRLEGPWETGLDFDSRLLWAVDPWWRQAYGVLADGHRLGGRRPRPSRYDIEYVPLPGQKFPTLEPGSSWTVSRRVIVAENLFALKAQAARALGVPLRRLRLVLTASDGPVADAEVRATAPGGLYAIGWTTVEGTFEAELPEGELHLEVRPFGRPVQRQTLAMSGDVVLRCETDPAGAVDVTVTDGTGVPLPCKVTVRGRDGTPDPFFFPETGDRRVRNVCYTADGRVRQGLPPGSYELFVSRGPEYELARQRVKIVPGRTSVVTARLDRVVDSTGWIAAHLHHHSTWSGFTELFYVYPYTKDPTVDGDSCASPLGRVLNLLAEGIEFAPSAEHNFIASYAPLIRELKAEAWLATCPGIGLTAGRRHTTTHQNAFPVPHVPGRQDGGAPQRPEHVQQLVWLARWTTGTERVIQIVVPRDTPLHVTREMDVLDVVDLRPLVELRPVEGADPRALDWLRKLREGYRLPAVVNEASFDNFHGCAGVRNYLRSPTDDPACIDPALVVRELKRGHVVMTTGPFLTVEARDPVVGTDPPAIPGDTMGSPSRSVELRVSVQSPSWIEVDRVQVLVNGELRPDLILRRAMHSDRFEPDRRRFTSQFRFALEGDAYLIVVASGSGLDPHGYPGKVPHVAVANPIWVDVDADGYSPASPLDDQVETTLGFVRPLLASPGAEPGRVRLVLTPRGRTSSSDVAVLEVSPSLGCRLIDPPEKSYQMVGTENQVALDWELTFEEEFLASAFPVVSAWRRGIPPTVTVPRSARPPGRRPASTVVAVDHPIRSISPSFDLGALAERLVREPAYPARLADGTQAGTLYFAIAGDQLAVEARIAGAPPIRREPLWEGACVEVFGSMPGRDPRRNPTVHGGYFPVRQVYLVPRTAQTLPEAYAREGDRVVPASDIAVTSRTTRTGYNLTALIPLARLAIDVDRPAFQIEFAGSMTPAHLLGEPPRPGRCLLEARVTLPAADGAMPARATVFGSRAPHVDHSTFGRMRLEGPVHARAELEVPVSMGGRGGPARLRVKMTNRTPEQVADVFRVDTLPPSLARGTPAAIPFALQPGQSGTWTVTLDLVTDPLAGGFYAIVPRSPAGALAGIPALYVPIVDRPLPELQGFGDLDQAGSLLSGCPRYPVCTETGRIAEVALAVCGKDLALHAWVQDVRPVVTDPPWKGACLEVFAAGTPGPPAGHVFLLPPSATRPGAALLHREEQTLVAEDVRVRSEISTGGYTIMALIPLATLGLDPASETLILEVQTSTAIEASRRVYGTAFGSVRAYQDLSQAGRFRIVRSSR